MFHCILIRKKLQTLAKFVRISIQIDGSLIQYNKWMVSLYLITVGEDIVEGITNFIVLDKYFEMRAILTKQGILRFGQMCFCFILILIEKTLLIWVEKWFRLAQIDSYFFDQINKKFLHIKYI